MSNASETASAKVSKLEALIGGEKPSGTEFFSKPEIEAGIKLPPQIFKQLQEKSLTLIILTTGDDRIMITVAPKPNEDQAFETAKVNSKYRGTIIESTYLTIYGDGQSQNWVHCSEVFNQNYSLLSRLAEIGLVKIPASLRILAEEITDSCDGQINDPDRAQKVLEALGDCLIQNGYFGRLNKLANLGYIPQNFQASTAGTNFD